jgi:FkbM family methyltransferase
MSIEYFDKESLSNWFRDKGDDTHRLNYDLNNESIVFDIGGYEGDWSDKIYKKFSPHIYIFEPVKKYYNYISKKFEGIDNIKVFDFGISNKNEYVSINDDGASSSIILKGNKVETIYTKNINDVIKELNLKKIDLIKINIEGSEYDLLESITDDNIILINNFQIQFHKIGDNYSLRRDNIRNRLSKTHKITFDYKFVWENWKKI